MKRRFWRRAGPFTGNKQTPKKATGKRKFQAVQGKGGQRRGCRSRTTEPKTVSQTRPSKITSGSPRYKIAKKWGNDLFNEGGKREVKKLPYL